MTAATEPQLLRLGHSPDPDDAFMWWPLEADDATTPPVFDPRFRFERVALDIERLNRRAEDAAAEDRLEITAISCAAYPWVSDRYVLTACGSSIGDGYGPKLVAPAGRDLASLEGARVAVPGLRTTAFVTSSLLLGPGRFTPVEVEFDRIEQAVAGGEVDAGVVIHEGQLTFERHGLKLLVDLGAWWRDRTGLPLPLGANAVRRDLVERLGAEAAADLAGLLRRSVEHAMDHREDSIHVAMGFARGLEPELADRFVEMYVNRWTLEYGQAGRRAVARLLGEAATAGLVPRVAEVDFLGPDGVEREPVPGA
ncbi:MAG: menaquinone biosynthesis family protein [Phycisphaerales bacterium]|jgi:1,4-dihydroxy-6-naphthoate synthase